MATTKPSRRGKHASHSKVRGKFGRKTVKDEAPRPDSRFSAHSVASTVMERRTRQSKDNITKGAVKKSNAKVAAQIAKVVATRAAPNNGRYAGRQLIRWTPYTDQILLLCMEYELKRHGVEIPFKAIASRLATEKVSTGACIQQHLNKLRNQMLDRGSWVPPLPGRNKGRKYENVRGFVKCRDGDDGDGIRVIEWTEDAMAFVNPGEIDQNFRAKKVYKGKRGVEIIHRSAGRYHSAGRVDINDGADLTELDSDEEVDCSADLKNKRVTRGSSKVAKYSHKDKFDSGSESEADAETNVGWDSESDYPPKKVKKTAPRMMSFNDSEAEEEDRLVVILRMIPNQLCNYPAGISGPGQDSYHGQVVVRASKPLAFANGEEESRVPKGQEHHEEEIKFDPGDEVDIENLQGCNIEGISDHHQATAPEPHRFSTGMIDNTHQFIDTEIFDRTNPLTYPYQGAPLDLAPNMEDSATGVHETVPIHPSDIADLNLLQDLVEVNNPVNFDTYAFPDATLAPVVSSQQIDLQQYNIIPGYDNEALKYAGDNQMGFDSSLGEMQFKGSYFNPDFSVMANGVGVLNDIPTGNDNGNVFGAEVVSGWVVPGGFSEPGVEQDLNSLASPAPDVVGEDDTGNDHALFDSIDFDAIKSPDFGDEFSADIGGDNEDRWDENLGIQWEMEIH